MKNKKISNLLFTSIVVTAFPSIFIAILMNDNFTDWVERIIYLATVVICVLINMIVLSIHDDIQRREY